MTTTRRAKGLATITMAVISGTVLIWSTNSQLGSGNIGVWPIALASFIVFAVTAPMSIYYRARWNDKTFDEKAKSMVEQQEALNGKK